MSVTIGIYRLDHAPDELPVYATPGSAALDIKAAIAEPVELAPMQRVLIATGFLLEIPEGYEVQIRPRSGLAITHGVTLVNAVGTIDSDYRDEVRVPLINLGFVPYTVQPGERIAQLLVAPVHTVAWEALSDEPKRLVRMGGFGSTGR